MDLHKSICTSAPARWKAIGGMIRTAGPRNWSKRCNHFVCCVRSPPPVSVFFRSAPIKSGCSAPTLPGGAVSDFHLDLSRRCLFFLFLPSLCSIPLQEGRLCFKSHANGLPALARGGLSVVNKRLIMRVNFHRLGI